VHRAGAIINLLVVLFLFGGVIAAMVGIVATSLGPYAGIKLTMNLFVKITLWASVFILLLTYIIDLFGG
jgi:hypothetical protein